MPQPPVTDQDSPWKEVLEQNLALVLEFCFPRQIHGELDWTSDYEVLEQELRELYPSGPSGKRVADCLFKIRRKGTGDFWYIHGEVQGRKDRHFRRRMHIYNSRAEERFGQPIGSFAILIDDNPAWRPNHYKTSLCATTRYLRFPCFKILDWQDKEDELRVHPNPFALFVLAQLASTRTKQDLEARTTAKLELILLLQQRNITAEELRHWYRYLDWLLALPLEYDRAIWTKIYAREKETTVPFVTFAERYGMEKGLIQGIEVVIDLRFPEASPTLLPLVRQLTQVDLLQHLLQRAKTATLDELRAAIETAAVQAK